MCSVQCAVPCLLCSVQCEVRRFPDLISKQVGVQSQQIVLTVKLEAHLSQGSGRVADLYSTVHNTTIQYQYSADRLQYSSVVHLVDPGVCSHEIFLLVEVEVDLGLAGDGHDQQEHRLEQ